MVMIESPPHLYIVTIDRPRSYLLGTMGAVQWCAGRCCLVEGSTHGHMGVCAEGCQTVSASSFFRGRLATEWTRRCRDGGGAWLRKAGRGKRVPVCVSVRVRAPTDPLMS